MSHDSDCPRKDTPHVSLLCLYLLLFRYQLIDSPGLTMPNPQEADRILQDSLSAIVPLLVLIGDVPVDEDFAGFFT